MWTGNISKTRGNLTLIPQLWGECPSLWTGLLGMSKWWPAGHMQPCKETAFGPWWVVNIRFMYPCSQLSWGHRVGKQETTTVGSACIVGDTCSYAEWQPVCHCCCLGVRGCLPLAQPAQWGGMPGVAPGVYGLSGVQLIAVPLWTAL